MLPADAPLGADVVELLALRDEVLDIAVTPDRGYTLSVRGVAREAATAFGLALADPGLRAGPGADRRRPRRCGSTDPRLRPLRRAASCSGLDPSAPSPAWLQRRLVLAGMRPVVAGRRRHQPRDARARAAAARLRPATRCTGEVVVRRARAGGAADDARRQGPGARRGRPASSPTTPAPIALAGVMGGGPTEVAGATTDAAAGARALRPGAVARTARRHRLPSEASKRYERGVDPALAAAAAEAAVALLVELGGATAGPVTDVDTRAAPPVLRLPARRAGARRRPAVRPGGRAAAARGRRLHGHRERRPGRSSRRRGARPHRHRRAGRGGRPARGLRHRAGRAAARARRSRADRGAAAAPDGVARAGRSGAGRGGQLPPFVGEGALGAARREQPASPRLANPLSAEEALMRPTLLPGLLAAVAAQHLARAARRRAVRDRPGVPRRRGRRAGPGRRRGRPTAAGAAPRSTPPCPAQPRHAGVAAGGGRPLGRPPVEALLALGRALGLGLQPCARRSTGPSTRAAAPSCCSTAGGSGSPASCTRASSPRWACPRAPGRRGRPRRARRGGRRARPGARAGGVALPAGRVDVALVVGDAVPAADVEAALRAGAGAAAGGAAAVRRLHRAAGRGGPALARLRAALPRRRPHPHRRRGARRPRRRGRREAGRRTGAVLRALSRVALVTGGSRGLGRAAAAALTGGGLAGGGHRPLAGGLQEVVDAGEAALALPGDATARPTCGRRRRGPRPSSAPSTCWWPTPGASPPAAGCGRPTPTTGGATSRSTCAASQLRAVRPPARHGRPRPGPGRRARQRLRHRADARGDGLRVVQGGGAPAGGAASPGSCRAPASPCSRSAPGMVPHRHDRRLPGRASSAARPTCRPAAGRLDPGRRGTPALRAIARGARAVSSDDFVAAAT